MQLTIDPRGQVRCVYAEALDLTSLGTVSIQRASHVEPDEAGCWWADLSPVGRPNLGPFPLRALALEAEGVWLEGAWTGVAGIGT
jgi:hypothetical protein